MNLKNRTYLLLFTGLVSLSNFCQQTDRVKIVPEAYTEAYELAYEGQHSSARNILIKALDENPTDQEARSLLASTYSWSGHYDKARSEFNKITSDNKGDEKVWIAAIKNELYAERHATALGLANKALTNLDGNREIERLRKMALKGIANSTYPDLGWHNQESQITTSPSKGKNKPAIAAEAIQRRANTQEVERHRIGINNSFTVFNERYDPMVYSSIQLRYAMKVGNLIPRINYSNRLGQHGVQYDIDFYPRFLKRFYAYLNYGFSNAEIYPNHKFGGDVYVSLPAAIEFSAGGRHIITQTQEITAITNSLGHYRGNYYFSLRSFITPRPDGLTRVSGNLLVRKYLKDAENFMGLTVGMGISPELQQIVAGDQLLAETLFYVESQRLRLEYQFTGKKVPNIYRANLGLLRQELASESGKFFWGVSAGLTYELKL